METLLGETSPVARTQFVKLQLAKTETAKLQSWTLRVNGSV